MNCKFDPLGFIKGSYSFKDIIEAQKLPLEQKIDISVAVLREAAKLSTHNIALAFSGGKDSEVVSDIIERFIPELHERIFCIFGNTGVEFPESLKFARKYGQAHYGDRFYETKRSRLTKPELRYDFARKLIAQLEEEGALSEVLKPDGKLKGQGALIAAAKKRGYTLDRSNCFFPGQEMNFMYCLEQYGAPLPGKARKLIADAPTVDAVPVVHGQWKTEFDDLGWLKHTCTVCGYVKRTDVHVSLGWNYCPNCGARMDGGSR